MGGAGLTLLTGISWLAIVEWLGDSTLSIVTAIVNKLRGTPPANTLTADLSVDNPLVTAQSEQITLSDDRHSIIDVDDSHADVSVSGEEPSSRFNIHIPQQTTSEKVETEVSSTTEAAAEVEVNRTEHLSATIEELEQEAFDADDLAKSSSASYAPVQVEEQESLANQTSTIEHLVEPTMNVGDIDTVIDETDLPQDRSTPTISDLDSLAVEATVDEQNIEQQSDPDVVAFQDLVEEAQKNMAGADNPSCRRKNRICRFQLLLCRHWSCCIIQKNERTI